jgi:hypothetical protein
MTGLSTALLLTALAHLAIGSALAQSKTVTVYKPDGTRYCQGGEIPLDEMAKQLVKAEIEVVSKTKGQDGLVHPQNCGGITGRLNTYDIASEDLEKARALGFKELTPPAQKSDK